MPPAPSPTGSDKDLAFHSDQVLSLAKALAADGEVTLPNRVNSLLNQIDALGDICGSDSEGRKAAADFQQARDKFTTYAGALAGDYVEVATRLYEMAGNVAVADWNIIPALPKVDQSVPISMPTA